MRFFVGWECFIPLIWSSPMVAYFEWGMAMTRYADRLGSCQDGNPGFCCSLSLCPDGGWVRCCGMHGIQGKRKGACLADEQYPCWISRCPLEVDPMMGKERYLPLLCIRDVYVGMDGWWWWQEGCKVFRARGGALLCPSHVRTKWFLAFSFQGEDGEGRGGEAKLWLNLWHPRRANGYFVPLFLGLAWLCP